jgi:hypothetical protein
VIVITVLQKSEETGFLRIGPFEAGEQPHFWKLPEFYVIGSLNQVYTQEVFGRGILYAPAVLASSAEPSGH